MKTKAGGVMAAIDLIDVFAKRKDKGKDGLRRWEDIIPKTSANQKKPDEASMFPSEFARQKIMAENQDNLRYIYTELKVWFEDKTQMSIDEFISDAEQVVLQHPLPSTWRE